MVRKTARRRRAHRRVVHAVGQPRLARRPDPAAAGVRASPPRAGVELRRGRGRGHFVRDADGEPFVKQWWMGTGSTVDFTSAAAEEWWREQVKRVLELGVEGIKADDGDGYYIPDDARLADGRTRRGGGVGARRPAPPLACSARSTRSTPAPASCSGAAAGSGQHATGLTWGGDQASDFWSLRVLVVATLTAACSGISQLVARRRRLPGPPARRALPARAARPLAAVRLLHAADAGACADAAGAVELRRAGARAVPGLRAAARAARAIRRARRRRPRRAPGCRSSGRCA